MTNNNLLLLTEMFSTFCLCSGQSFYQSSNEFRCLDGSSAFPYERVNDDYCDCKDGTDEPGEKYLFPSNFLTK